MGEQHPHYPLGFLKAHDAFRRNQQCGRKKQYATEQAAKSAGCRVYKCPYCQHYHRATLPDYKDKSMR